MANIKSQIKRNRTNYKDKQYNTQIKSKYKTFTNKVIKTSDGAVNTSDLEQAKHYLNLAFKAIDKAQKKGVFKPNNADRKKSKINRYYNDRVDKFQNRTDDEEPRKTSKWGQDRQNSRPSNKYNRGTFQGRGATSNYRKREHGSEQRTDDRYINKNNESATNNQQSQPVNQDQDKLSKISSTEKLVDNDSQKKVTSAAQIIDLESDSSQNTDKSEKKILIKEASIPKEATKKVLLKSKKVTVSSSSEHEKVVGHEKKSAEQIITAKKGHTSSSKGLEEKVQSNTKVVKEEKKTADLETNNKEVKD